MAVEIKAGDRYSGDGDEGAQRLIAMVTDTDVKVVYGNGGYACEGTISRDTAERCITNGWWGAKLPEVSP